jgi:uncharacterized protein (DUF2225 family)
MPQKRLPLLAAAALPFAVCLALAASAHTSATITLTCPVDGEKFSTVVTVSMTTFGSYLDFQKHGAIGSYYEDIIHSCPKCHFAGTDDEFKQKVDPKIAERVKAELAPVQKGQKLDHVTECEFAARIYEWQGRKNEEVGNVYLIASYLLRDDAARQEKRRELQLAAGKYFIKAIEAKELGGAERAAVSYLVAELHRRAGEFDQAVTWYDAALGDKEKPEWLKEVAAKQRALAVKKDANNKI